MYLLWDKLWSKKLPFSGIFVRFGCHFGSAYTNIYRANDGHALLQLFTARFSRDLVSRRAFGPKGLKNIQTLVTLITVVMATKKPP